MSVRASATGPALQVKKTRTSTAAKKDAPPKAPRTKKSTTAATKTSSKTNSPARPEPSLNEANKGGDDLDTLVSGIKKITLVTNKQKQARAREAKKASPKAEGQANAQGVPATPMAKSLFPQDSSHTPPNGDKAHQITRSKKELEPEMKQRETPTTTPLVNIPGAGTGKVTTPAAAAPPADNFVHYQPDGPVPEALLTPQQPLSWLPVNTGASPTPARPEITHDGGAAAIVTSPTPGTQQEQPQPPPPPMVGKALMSPSPMKRGEAPVFTPTTQLRFANPRPGAQKVDDDGVWEVPEAPR